MSHLFHTVYSPPAVPDRLRRVQHLAGDRDTAGLGRGHPLFRLLQEVQRESVRVDLGLRKPPVNVFKVHICSRY